MKLRWKQGEGLDDATADLRNLAVILIERIAVDNRDINSLGIKQIVNCFRLVPASPQAAPRILLSSFKTRAISVHGLSLCKADRCAFQEPPANPARPGIDTVADHRIVRRCRPRIVPFLRGRRSLGGREKGRDNQCEHRSA